MNADLDIVIRPGRALSDHELDEIFKLFDQSYDQANHGYLLKSFDVMRWIALAKSTEGLAGFAVGDAVETVLPRLDGPQIIAMAGIACIDTNYRRTGLFGRLALSSVMESGLFEGTPRFLMCGRMAHAASYRALVKAGTNAIPLAGQPLSPWQREVMACVAGLYKADVDLETGRVIGKGKPIGFPRLDLQSTEDEKSVFASVDRTKGDSLLALSWRPEAPEGW